MRGPSPTCPSRCRAPTPRRCLDRLCRAEGTAGPFSAARGRTRSPGRCRRGTSGAESASCRWEAGSREDMSASSREPARRSSWPLLPWVPDPPLAVSRSYHSFGRNGRTSSVKLAGHPQNGPNDTSRWYGFATAPPVRLPILASKERVHLDVLVAATFGIPGGVGLIAGFYGWRAGAASAVAGTLALSAGVYVYGALPATDCGDCTRYALFLPVAWVF